MSPSVWEQSRLLGDTWSADFSVRSWEGSDEHDDSDLGGHDEDNEDFENNEDDVDDNDQEHHSAIKCSQEERHVCGEPHFLCRIFAFW